MLRWRAGTVTGVRRRWPGAVECEVRVDTAPRGSAGPEADGGAADAPGAVVRALAYVELVGCPVAGDRVLLNTAALARGLGTGGYAMVVALPEALPADPPAGPGHLVKARYTPLQAMVLGVDEQESEHHDALAGADDLGGAPVVVADLHSALPAVLAGVRSHEPGARVVYVLTDGGALPAAFSRAVAGLREAGWLAACVSTGQSFGGDLEAATVHTGMLAARLVAGADVLVVAQGPGNLGTGSRWGFSGVAAGEALNAATVLGGRAVAALRVSQADARERHRGLSHHSATAVGRVALAPVDVAVPAAGDEAGGFWDGVREQARALCAPVGRHRLVEVGTAGLDEALGACPVPLSTMGRGPQQDRAAFVAAAVAGRHAAALLG
ncbi:DUF3866 family protein [Paenibacillus sp. TRM 82003]|uniref:DUF3866 family protein n=1 Tax=Kineococcus sp. TRM81007 TaxID=2925831 RepID=UPI001F581CAD|nr:DUF3866 family protein [Kineococcus sp. TRM81007]MCI2237717.1 DUF3866 family protein [Kineococcus sp. TRM81007]MCI3921735.1 DUF3866 family protein [Paenibacillus sp. TRM 82003]